MKNNTMNNTMKTLVYKTVFFGDFSGNVTITGAKPVVGGSATMLMETVKRLRWLAETNASDGTRGYKDMICFSEKEERLISLAKACKKATVCWLKACHEEFQTNTFFPEVPNWTVRELINLYDELNEAIALADKTWNPETVSEYKVDKMIEALSI